MAFRIRKPRAATEPLSGILPPSFHPRWKHIFTPIFLHTCRRRPFLIPPHAFLLAFPFLANAL